MKVEGGEFRTPSASHANSLVFLQCYIRKAQAVWSHQSMSYSYLERLERTIKQHEEWRVGECLNLIPSENQSSSHSRSVFMTDLGNRYSAPDKFYRGTRYLDEVQALAEDVAKKGFSARDADVRPLSGHTADMVVLLSLATNGDKIIAGAPLKRGDSGNSHP